MSTSAKTSAAPAHPKSTEVPPAIFEWYENRVQEGLQYVYREDKGQRQRIVEIMEEMNDSHLFWKLISAYSDACEDQEKNHEEQFKVLLPLLARIYIAGTRRGYAVMD